MGRYLAYGVAPQISLYSKELKNKEDKNKVLDELGKSIDLSFYNITEEAEGYDLRLDVNKFKSQFHEFIREIYPYMDCEETILNLFDSKIPKKNGRTYGNLDIKTFDEEKFPINLIEGSSNKYCLKGTDNEIDSDQEMVFYSPILLRNYDGDSKFNIGVETIPIWIDFNKYLSEDETMNLYLLNVFSRNFFKSSLSRCMLFYITG